MGHDTVAVYAEPDANAPHVAEASSSVGIGPADLARSYLSADALLLAADRAGADAVHPGYGFLSEQSAFARAVVASGRIWIGPHPDAIDRMGSKIEARRLAAEAGVPVIPGFDESQDPEVLATEAERIGFPVLIKASAGGGGRGIRIANHASEFAGALESATSEARLAFGDDRVIVERYITRPRHVEVQVIGDGHGNVVHLGTRECSVQRRYQKLLEEAPAPNLPDDTRHGLCAAAVALATSIGYDSAGTVEYVVDDTNGDFFFLEMNTRLQVEHPVTEEITGLDLVELMIRSAEGRALPLNQDQVTFSGHSFEARITAEDASLDFRPDTGTIHQLRIPDGARWESAVEPGSEVSPHYDPMIAKLIVDGHDRSAALAALRRALDLLIIDGLPSTAPFHRWLIDQPPVVEGRVTTRFLDEHTLPAITPRLDPARVAALAWVAAGRLRSDENPWTALSRFRMTPHHSPVSVGLEAKDGTLTDVTLDSHALNGLRLHGATLEWPDADGVTRQNVVAVGDRRVAVNIDGATHGYRVVPRSARWSAIVGSGHAVEGALVAPFPGAVAEVTVAVGDDVSEGQTLVVLEAMKMLHPLPASGDGTVAEVRVRPGDQVESHAVLLTFEPPAADAISTPASD
jgi:3-methylcrotonyl-CoA carboxylase alpha subunit